MELQEINTKLENTPYFAMQGKRSIAYYRRYSFARESGYRVSKSEVTPYL